MKQIIEYQVVSSNSFGLLAEKVNSEIERGWQPFGNMLLDDDDGSYLQPMVRYSD